MKKAEGEPGGGGLSVSRALYGGKFFVWQYDVRWSKSSRIFPFSEGGFLKLVMQSGNPPCCYLNDKNICVW